MHITFNNMQHEDDQIVYFDKHPFEPVASILSSLSHITMHQSAIFGLHYSDTMASQISGVSIVCSTVCSGIDQRKHQSSASLAFVRGIYQWPVNSPHKRPVTWKMFSSDDVITEYHLRIPSYHSRRLTVKEFTVESPYQSPVSLRAFPSFTIQIQWKFAVLSWHVRKFVAIWWPATELQQGEVSIEFELCGQKIISETGPKSTVWGRSIWYICRIHLEFFYWQFSHLICLWSFTTSGKLIFILILVTRAVVSITMNKIHI